MVVVTTPASASFAGPTAITIDGNFADWGTQSSPSNGATCFRDFNGNPGDGSGYVGTEKDILYFWMAASTANGGSEIVSSSNRLQNLYYRFDTNSTSASTGQAYNIQLNTGQATVGYADHLLQIYIDSRATPQVKIVLQSYNTPFPALRAFTSGLLTPDVSNIASGYGVYDANASGAIGIGYQGNYSVEVKIPIVWFGSTYGGQLKDDGTGACTIVIGAGFTSTGSLGAVGTVKDTLGVAGADCNFMLNSITGESSYPTTAITKLAITTPQRTIVAGTVTSVITVQTQMATGEPANVGTSTSIVFSSTSSAGRFDSSSTGTFSSATLTVTISAGANSASFYYKDTITGTPTLTGAESPSQGWTDATQNVVVTPSAFDHFTISSYPASTVAGSNFGSSNVVVTAYDTYGNVKTDYTGQVYFTSTDPHPATLPYTSGSKYTFTGSGGDNGAHTFSGTGFSLFTTTSQTITVTDGAISATSSSITVTPATLNHFTISGYPASTAAGGNFGSSNVVVTAYDIYNNVKTDYTGQVYFTSTDPHPATLPYTSGSKYTFTGGDNGAHTFPGTGFSLFTTASQTITVTDGAISATGSSITVTPSTLHHFTISGYPASTAAGGNFDSNNVVITAYDIYNNVKTDYTGQVYFTSTDPHPATLPYTSGSKYTFTGGDNGAHTFPGTGFSLFTTTSQTITATDGALSATSSGITVTPTTLDHFTISGCPSSVTAGLTFGTDNVIVTVYDLYGNVKTDYTGQVYFASTDPYPATLPYTSVSKYTFTGSGADNGVHTFPGIGFSLYTTDSQTITVTDGFISNTGNAIAVVAASVDHFAITSAGSATAGTPFSATVIALDAFGNTVVGFVGQVHFSTDDLGSGVVLPADYEFTLDDAGGHTFTNGFTLVTAGTRSLEVSLVEDATKHGACGIDIGPGALFAFGLDDYPLGVSPGSSFSARVTALDLYGNVVTTFAGSVYFTSTDELATLPFTSEDPYTFDASENGVHEFSGFSLQTLGDQRISATDGTHTTISAPINVYELPDHFLVEAPADATAGSAFSVTVTAYDAEGRVMNGYTGVVHFSSTDGHAGVVLPADYTFIAGEHGSHVFTNGITLLTMGTQTISVNDVAYDVAEGSDDVVVNHALAEGITISPGSAEIVAGGSQTFIVEAVDAYGNSWDVTSETTFDISDAARGSWTGATYTSEKAGEWTVTAACGELVDDAPLTVERGSAASIQISPSSADIEAGTSQVYSVDAVDAYGNSWDVTSEASFEIDAAAGGSWAGSTYTAENAGEWTVTAILGSLEDSSSLDVQHSAAVSISISPAYASIEAGGSQAYAAEATDTYGNTWDVTSSAIYSIEEGGGGSWSGATYTSEKTGTWTVTCTLEGLEDDALIGVDHSSAVSIVLSPRNICVLAGTAVGYEVSAYDSFGNSWDVISAEFGINAEAGGSWSGASYTSEKEGDWTVTASLGSLHDETGLAVSHGALDHVEITPASASITAGGSQTYAAFAVDAFGNTWGITAETSFTINTNAGGSWTGSTYTSEKAGTWTVNGTYSGVTYAASLTVEHAAAVAINILPTSSEIQAGGSESYTAMAVDEFGNTWDATEETIFEIEEAARGSWDGATYTAEKAGAWTVSAFLHLLEDSATLTVTHSDIDSVVISPASAEIVAGGSQAYSATAIDAYGNTWDVSNDAVFSIDDAAGGSWADATYTAEFAGTWTVTCTIEGMSDIASLSVVHSSAVSIEISPRDELIAAGASQEYSATAFDAYGNSWDAASSSSFGIDPEAGGSWTGATYTSENEGEWTVTASMDGLHDETSLTVGHGAVDHVIITPASTSIVAGQSQAYVATAYDSSGNSWDVTPETSFGTDIDAGGSWTGATYTTEKAGTWTINGTYDSAIYTATLEVRHGVAASIALSPSSSDVVAGESRSFTVAATDAYGNSWDVTDEASFSIDEEAGGTWAGATYTAEKAGTWAVTCSLGDLDDSASLTVAHSSAVSIGVYPQEASITAGTSQEYAATATDAYGNTWDVSNDAVFSIDDAAGGSWSGATYTSEKSGTWAVVCHLEDLEASASISVGHSSAVAIAISPENVCVIAGTSLEYMATAVDAYGNTWNATSSADFAIEAGAGGSWSGSTYTSEHEGDWTVTASLGLIHNETGLAVSHGALDHVVITPASASITAGGAQTYTATAYDALGNAWNVTAETAFSTDTKAGGSWSGSTYTSENAGIWTMNGTYAGTTYTASLTVEHGIAASISLSPQSSSICAGQCQPYAATASDACGNTWDVTYGVVYDIDDAAGGSWNSSMYTSEKAGAWTVTATMGDLSDTASLRVDHALASSIQISPSSASIDAGEQQAYSVMASDAYGNTWDITEGATYGIDDAAGGSWYGPLYTSEKMGHWTVTATMGDLSDTASLSVYPAPAISIEMSPSSAEIVAGDWLDYSVIATDAYGNRWPAAPATSFGIPEAAGGHWDGSAYFSEKAGEWTVTATYGILNETSTLRVNHSAADSISISPSTASIQAGASQPFSATAADIYGNTWDVTSSASFEIAEAAGGSWSGATYTSEKAGDWTVTASFGLLEDEAALTVGHAAIDSLEISPSSATILAGQSQTYAATASDAYGNTWDVTADAWFLIDGEALGSWAGPTYTAEKAGSWIVSCAYAQTYDEASLRVDHSSARVIGIWPPQASIAAGASQSYSALAADRYHNTWDITDVAVFEIESGAGGSWSGHVYTSHNAGQWKVTVFLGELFDEAGLEVTHGAVDSVVITPGSAVVTAGQSQSFTATAYDELGNSWDVTSSTDFDTNSHAGGSWSGSTYSAEKAGTWTVNGTYEGVTYTASLTVEHDEAASILVSPESSDLTAGGSQEYVVIATDAYANSWEVTSYAILSIDVAAGGSWDGPTYTSEKAGEWTVSASFASLNSEAALNVIHASAISIELAPASSSLTAGGSQSYIATATDAYGNSWNATGSTVFAIEDEAGGSWSAETYTSEKSGEWAVTGTCAGLQDTSSLLVEHASAVSIATSPGSASIEAGGSQSFTVTATDAYGNTWDVTSSASFAIDEEAGGSWDGPTYTSEKAGEWAITVTLGQLQNEAALSVNHSSPLSIEVSPASSEVMAGASLYYSVAATDAFGNTWNATASAAFGIDASAGGSWSGSVYTSERMGEWTVNASLGDLQDDALLTVFHAYVVSLELSPASSSVTAGGQQSYMAIATDIYGNAWNVTGSTEFNIDASAGGSWSGSVYTSEHAGEWTVSGSFSGLTDAAALVVQHADAISIVIVPGSASITAGSIQSYIVSAIDAYGNSWDVTDSVVFSISAGAGGSWSGAAYSSQRAGEWTVTAVYGLLGAYAGLEVGHAAPVSLAVSPSNSELEAGASRRFTATATDAYGNSWDVSAEAVWSISPGAGGQWRSATYTAQNAGEWTVRVSYAGMIAAATLDVYHSAAVSLQIEPMSANVLAGQSLVYSAYAADRYGNIWDVTDLALFTIDAGAAGRWAGNVYTSEVVGIWQVVAAYSGMRSSATLFVNHGGAAGFEVLPHSSTIIAGTSISYTAVAWDSSGNRWDVTLDTEFSIETAALGTWTGPTYHSQRDGTWVVRGMFSGSYAAAELIVTHAEAIGLRLSPAWAIVIAGSAQEYTVEAFDAQGNTWDVTSGAAYAIDEDAGGVWSSNVYTSQNQGVWEVVARALQMEAAAFLEVDHAAACTFEIMPAEARLVAGGSQEYEAWAEDELGNRWNATTGTDFSIDAAAGGEWTGATYRSEKSGVWIVAGQYQGLVDNALLIVSHEEASSIVLSPGYAEVEAGQEQEYSVTAVDSFGNEWDVTLESTLAIEPDAGGSWAGAVYASQYIGYWTVTANYRSSWTSAGILVQSIPLYLIMEPTEATVAAGTSIEYRAWTMDDHGNVWNVTGTAAWSIDSLAEGHWQGSTYFTERVGAWSVTCRADGLTATSNLTVHFGPAVMIEIFPTHSSVEAGYAITYSAQASDAQGNAWTVTGQTVWSIDAGAGGSWAGSIFQTQFAGTWSVAAGWNGLSTYASLQVRHGGVVSLEIVPANATVLAGQEQAYVATATDAQGNTWDVSNDSTWAADPEALGTWHGPNYESQKAGAWTVTALYASLSAQAELKVLHGAAAALAVSPSTEQVEAGTAVPYAAIASDAYGNHWDVTGRSSWSISPGANGTWNGGNYTSATAGTWSVQASYDSISAYAELVVAHSSATRIAVEPASAVLTAGDRLYYSCIAFDASGNSWNVTSLAGFHIDSGAGGSWSGSVYTSCWSGSWNINASWESMTARASLRVLPGAFDHLSLTMPSAIGSGVSFNVTVAAWDRLGNLKTDFTGQVSFQSDDSNPGVRLPANYTFTLGDMGRHEFSGLVLISDGARQITVSSAGVSSASSSIVVSTTGSSPLWLLLPIALLLLLIVLAVRRIAIVSAPQTIKAGATSGPVKVQLTHIWGRPAKARRQMTLRVTSSSAGLLMSAAGNGPFVKELQIAIAEKGSTAEFFVSGNASGEFEVIVKGKGLLLKGKQKVKVL
jgi:hypothetical protein